MNILQMIFLKIDKIFIFIFVFSLFFLSVSSAKENKILLKVNNEIITTMDILNEIEYLSIINSQFRTMKKNIQIDIAKNSLVKEKIKIIELSKYKKNLKINEKLMENIVIKSFSNFNINSTSDFELFFKKKKINTEFIKKKITIETLRNKLIYIKINKNKKKKNISNRRIQKEYLLSEIIINADSSKDFERKLQLVKNTIKEKNFSQAAIIHSSSKTAQKSGDLGWVKESVLNNKIKNELNSINIGNFTNAIIVPGGLLILKIEDIRKTKKTINIENEIKSIIEKKTNVQLKRLSSVYLNKIKKNVSINEI